MLQLRIVYFQLFLSKVFHVFVIWISIESSKSFRLNCKWTACSFFSIFFGLCKTEALINFCSFPVYIYFGQAETQFKPTAWPLHPPTASSSSACICISIFFWLLRVNNFVNWKQILSARGRGEMYTTHGLNRCDQTMYICRYVRA